MENNINLIELLEYIQPSSLDYQEWINVGMALKEAGYTAYDWDNWSKQDGRYHKGECFRKWETFRGTAVPVTAGTIVQMAKDNGWIPQRKEYHELGWNDLIGAKDDLVVVDSAWIEGKDIHVPTNWDPVKDLITYIETLFDSTEIVGYVTETWEKDGKYLPTKGNWDRTAGELIQALNKCKGDIGAVLGDYKKEAGAWIRFNPLDGKGVRNDNVTEYKYALVESDAMELDKQNAILRELELPIACLVFSGKKSIHAIVKVDAPTYDEYRKRVEYLYSVCKKNGLVVDTQNKNPSRLSRMPGVVRGDSKQFLIDTNIGKESWDEWKEWIESINDDLPDPESLSEQWEDMPELAEPLIEGVLRKGHKMLIAGPSKAGKSFALIEMCIAIAEGSKWLEWNCTQGKVLYVNLELDRASCLHRFKDVYNALGLKPSNLANIDIWNLRGRSIPMDKLAPKLIRRAAKKDYLAIVIDPIYKIITGDENSADQMAHFCNQFDKVCTELGCAVIYCHHHSKGSQGGKKSMDRASGSGVFARDPDALLDLIELETTDAINENAINNAACEVCMGVLEEYVNDWKFHVSQDDICSSAQMKKACKEMLSDDQYDELLERLTEKSAEVLNRTAWRIEGTLREFPKFSPVNLWFDYPIHKQDKSGALGDIVIENSKGSPWKKNFNNKKTPEDKKKERIKTVEQNYESLKSFEGGKVTLANMAEAMGVTEKTVKNRLKEHGGFLVLSSGEIVKK
ncbi:MAG: AAA family ATPase [Lachnospiraceae bacterium]|nr:AAA family ATPase [Lachnospiraceae bacterium]